MHFKRVFIVGLAPVMVSGRALSRRAVTCDLSIAPAPGATCESFALSWGVPSVDALKALNPGITCPGLDTSKEYCVVGTVTDDPSTTASTQSSTTGLSSTSTQIPRTTQPPTTTTAPTTTSKPSTTTTASAPNDTPSPIQDGMVANCNRFHWVADGQDCASIAALYSLTVAQFVQWNPAAKSDCSGLWARTHACVGVKGSTPTTTTPGNGIATPTPTHPGMVNNCNKFTKVNPGDTCDIISFYNGPISTDDFVKWNTGVGGRECKSLQLGTYVCVGVLGGSTPTQPGNGIATPTPIQPGMVSNCNKFTKVNPGDTCDIISFFNGPISTADFIKWNTGVGGQRCNLLQLGTYVCIGVQK